MLVREISMILHQNNWRTSEIYASDNLKHWKRFQSATTEYWIDEIQTEITRWYWKSGNRDLGHLINSIEKYACDDHSTWKTWLRRRYFFFTWERIFQICYTNYAMMTAKLLRQSWKRFGLNVDPYVADVDSIVTETWLKVSKHFQTNVLGLKIQIMLWMPHMHLDRWSWKIMINTTKTLNN